MLATKIHRTTETDVEESEGSNDEQAYLSEGGSEPQPSCRCGVGGDSESGGTT